MKINKFFRVLSGLLSLIFAIVLLAVTAVAVLPQFGIDLAEVEFISNLGIGNILDGLKSGIESTTREITSLVEFMAGLGDYAQLAVVGAIFALPALLLIIEAIIMFTRQKRGKGKYVFAFILAFIGLALFTAGSEYFIDHLYGPMLLALDLLSDEVLLYCRIGIGAFAGLMFLLLLLSVVGKKPKEVQPAADAAASETHEEVTETPAQNQEVQPMQPWGEVAKPEPIRETTQNNSGMSWDEQYTAAAGAQQEYVPEDAKRTTSDVLEYTYRTPTEDLSETTVKKLHTLRSLLNAHAITETEYNALVDRYLNPHR